MRPLNRVAKTQSENRSRERPLHENTQNGEPQRVCNPKLQAPRQTHEKERTPINSVMDNEKLSGMVKNNINCWCLIR